MIEEMKIGTIGEDNIGTSNTSEPIVPRSYCTVDTKPSIITLL
jgi:hypothetical protein